MKRRKKIKYIHEGQYVAEVKVELIEDETGGPLILVSNMLINWTMCGIHFAMEI